MEYNTQFEMLRCIYESLFSASLPHVATNRQSLNHEIPTRKNWTHKIPTTKNFGSTKYPQEKYLHPRNTHEKKNLDPRNSHEKNFLKYSRRHDDFRFTRPTAARDPLNLAHSLRNHTNVEIFPS